MSQKSIFSASSLSDDDMDEDNLEDVWKSILISFKYFIKFEIRILWSAQFVSVIAGPE